MNNFKQNGSGVKPHFGIDLAQIKADVSIPTAWQRLGLPGHPQAGKCTSSPLREDRHPSFSISSCGRYFKDHGTGAGGDVLTFVTQATGQGFKEALAWLTGSASADTLTPRPRLAQRKPAAPTEPKKFVLPAIDSGTITELKTVANSRGFSGFWGMQMAADAGHFGFTHYRGHRCWLVYDDAGHVAQARRIDGEPFHGGSKSITLYGSNARWPVGASSITDDTNMVFLCEGSGDWLTAQAIHAWDETPWQAVCMLGASMLIDADALDRFRDKEVLIYVQNDDAGHRAARCWAKQLEGVAANVSAQVPPMPGEDINDYYTDEESELPYGTV